MQLIHASLATGLSTRKGRNALSGFPASALILTFFVFIFTMINFKLTDRQSYYLFFISFQLGPGPSVSNGQPELSLTVTDRTMTDAKRKLYL